MGNMIFATIYMYLGTNNLPVKLGWHDIISIFSNRYQMVKILFLGLLSLELELGRLHMQIGLMYVNLQFTFLVISGFLEFSYFKKEKYVLYTATHRIQTFNIQIQNPWRGWSPLVVIQLLDDLLGDLMTHLSWYPWVYIIHYI